MSTLAQRSTVLQLIDEACSAGARQHLACARNVSMTLRHYLS
jgi:hypothetical protein